MYLHLRRYGLEKLVKGSSVICLCFFRKLIQINNILSDNLHRYTLEKTEGEIRNGQPRDTGNIGHTRHRTETPAMLLIQSMRVAHNYAHGNKNVSYIYLSRNICFFIFIKQLIQVLIDKISVQQIFKNMFIYILFHVLDKPTQMASVVLIGLRMFLYISTYISINIVYSSKINYLCIHFIFTNCHKMRTGLTLSSVYH